MEDTNMPFSWPDADELTTSSEGSTVDNIISTIKNIVESATTDDEILAATSNADTKSSFADLNDLKTSLSDSISSRFSEIVDSAKPEPTTTFNSLLDGLFNFSIDTQQTVSKIATDIKEAMPSSTVAASTTSEASSEGTTEKILSTITEKATSMVSELVGDTETPTEHSTIIISSTMNPSAGSEEFISNVSSTINSIVNSTIETATNSGFTEESLSTTLSTLNVDENANSTISEVITNSPVVNSTSSIITELFTSEIISTTDSSIFTSGNASEVTRVTTGQPEVTETTTMEIITSTVNQTVEHSVKIGDDDQSTVYIIVGSVLLLLVVLIIGMVFIYKRYNHKLSLRSGDYCVNQLKEVKTHKGMKNNEHPAAKDCSNTRF